MVKVADGRSQPFAERRKCAIESPRKAIEIYGFPRRSAAFSLIRRAARDFVFAAFRRGR